MQEFDTPQRLSALIGRLARTGYDTTDITYHRVWSRAQGTKFRVTQNTSHMWTWQPRDLHVIAKALGLRRSAAKPAAQSSEAVTGI